MFVQTDVGVQGNEEPVALVLNSDPVSGWFQVNNWYMNMLLIHTFLSGFALLLGASEPGSGLVLDFTPPAADYLDLRNRLKAQQVCLETCSVQDHLLSGTVQVRNICFEKSVSVRITFDSWSSFQDIRCQYLNNVYGCPDTDTFAFSVSVPKDLVSPTRLEFCIKYQTKEQVHWDNNLGRNYRLTMVDPTGCPNWTSGRNTGRDTQRDGSRQKMDKMEFDPFGSPRTSAGIFPEWQSWSRVETGAPYW